MYLLHRCECPSGYEGISCETKVDDCIGNTCKNNVTCIDLVGSCSRGFIGVHCETKSALLLGNLFWVQCAHIHVFKLKQLCSHLPRASIEFL